MENKRQLQQIKIFKLSDFNTSDELTTAVNEFVVELFNLEGNFSKIETNSKYISVISDRLIKTNRI